MLVDIEGQPSENIDDFLAIYRHHKSSINEFLHGLEQPPAECFPELPGMSFESADTLAYPFLYAPCESTSCSECQQPHVQSDFQATTPITEKRSKSGRPRKCIYVLQDQTKESISKRRGSLLTNQERIDRRRQQNRESQQRFREKQKNLLTKESRL